MAYDFQTAYIISGQEIISDTDPRPITIATWVKQDANDANQGIYGHASGSGTPVLYVGLNASGGSTVQRLYAGGYATDSTSWTFTSNWQHVAWSLDGSSPANVYYYRNGSANGSTTKSYGSGGTSGTGIVGALNATPTFPINGKMAEFAIWNAVLDAWEHAALGSGVSPLSIRPGALVRYLPLLRSTTRELISGTWSTSGTLVVEDHPRVIYPTRPYIVTAPAAAVGGGSIPVFMHHYKQLRCG